MTLFNKIKKIFYLYILKRKYYRSGSCSKCGACCENIYIRHNSKIIQTKEEFEKIKENDDYSFYKHVDIVGSDDFGLIFSCNKFDKDKRLCKDHKHRPSICRKYPSEQIFSFGAQLQDKCGFKFKPIQSFDEVLQKISKKSVKSFEEIN